MKSRMFAPRSLRWLGVAAVFSASLAVAAPAQAQPKPPLATSLSGASRSDYEAGRTAFAAGDFSKALIHFTRAHEVSSDPRLLWNMAACEKSLKRYAVAYSLVTRYLKEGSSMVPAEAVANAKETLKALRASYSLLTLKNVPPEALVFVDGASVRPTSEDPVVLDVGAHKVKVTADGFVPFEADVTALGTTDVSLEVVLRQLAPSLTRLAINASEEEANVSVDGTFVGQGRWEGALAPGPHTVKVTAAGKKPFETILNLEPERPRTIDVTLDSSRPVWPWIVGGAVVVVSLTVLGIVLLKPEDEPGSAPAGKLGTVQLPTGVRF